MQPLRPMAPTSSGGPAPSVVSTTAASLPAERVEHQWAQASRSFSGWTSVAATCGYLVSGSPILLWTAGAAALVWLALWISRSISSRGNGSHFRFPSLNFFDGWRFERQPGLPSDHDPRAPIGGPARGPSIRAALQRGYAPAPFPNPVPSPSFGPHAQIGEPPRGPPVGQDPFLFSSPAPSRVSYPVPVPSTGFEFVPPAPSRVDMRVPVQRAQIGGAPPPPVHRVQTAPAPRMRQAPPVQMISEAWIPEPPRAQVQSAPPPPAQRAAFQVGGFIQSGNAPTGSSPVPAPRAQIDRHAAIGSAPPPPAQRPPVQVGGFIQPGNAPMGSSPVPAPRAQIDRHAAIGGAPLPPAQRPSFQVGGFIQSGNAPISIPGGQSDLHASIGHRSHHVAQPVRQLAQQAQIAARQALQPPQEQRAPIGRR